MPGVARATVDHITCSTLNVISAGSPDVFVNNNPVARIDDPTPGHPGGGPSSMKTGNGNNVYANGILICIQGSENHPHGGDPHGPTPPTVATASNNVFIG